jgi:hypothetical protein
VDPCPDSTVTGAARIQQPGNPEPQGRAEGIILRAAFWGFFVLLLAMGLVLFLAGCWPLDLLLEKE